MEDSTVLAVVGPWGSGKSSVINLACEELRKVDASWKVCPANVWAPRTRLLWWPNCSPQSALLSPTTNEARRSPS